MSIAIINRCLKIMSNPFWPWCCREMKDGFAVASASGYCSYILHWEKQLALWSPSKKSYRSSDSPAITRISWNPKD